MTGGRGQTEEATCSQGAGFLGSEAGVKGTLQPEQRFLSLLDLLLKCENSYTRHSSVPPSPPTPLHP